jgi:MraZ protein
MPLTGNFKRSIDDKQRITIPKDLRTALGESVGKVFYVAPGTDGSLAVYDEASFERVASRLDSAPPTERDVRAFSRLFYAQAHRVEIDRQSRLRVPQQLADWAGLAKEAVLIGAGDHMELWDSAKWETYAAEKQSNYDQLAEAAFSQSSHSN